MPQGRPALRFPPSSYDPFQLIRLFECADTTRPRVGSSLHTAEDIISFGQPPSLAFATSSVAAIVEGGPRPKLLQNAFGLLGPNGPLPLHITEYVDDRERHHHDSTLVAFCDFLSNRLTALFYRAWAVNQAAVSYDRLADDRFGFYGLCLLGLGTEGLSGRDSLDDNAKLFMAPRLRHLPSSAESLEQVLGHWFQVPCHVEQMVGEWIEIPEDRLTRLGDSADTGSLGSTSVVGGRVWDVQTRFRVHLGPMAIDQYQRLLPGASGMQELEDWVRLQSGLEFGWDAKLVLREDQVPAVKLGESGALGHTTWLGAAGRDRDDLVVQAVA